MERFLFSENSFYKISKSRLLKSEKRIFIDFQRFGFCFGVWNFSLMKNLFYKTGSCKEEGLTSRDNHDKRTNLDAQNSL